MTDQQQRLEAQWHGAPWRVVAAFAFLIVGVAFAVAWGSIGYDQAQSRVATACVKSGGEWKKVDHEAGCYR